MQILVDHFSVLLQAQASGASALSALDPKLLEILKQDITDAELGLTATAYSSLRNAGITHLIHLVPLKPKDLEKFRGIGKESVEKIENALHKLGLKLGMDVSAYKAHLSL
jgi:DNA-directed RNA polymerase alpha subunit